MAVLTLLHSEPLWGFGSSKYNRANEGLQHMLRNYKTHKAVLIRGEGDSIIWHSTLSESYAYLFQEFEALYKAKLSLQMCEKSVSPGIVAVLSNEM